MLKYYFYMFILYNNSGKKLKEVLNELFPGLIKEPARVRVPVRVPDPRREERRRQA